MTQLVGIMMAKRRNTSGPCLIYLCQSHLKSCIINHAGCMDNDKYNLMVELSLSLLIIDDGS